MLKKQQKNISKSSKNQEQKFKTMKKDISLYTEAGICIDSRVKNKETVLFYDREIAEFFAKRRKTYVYSAVNKRREFECFAVPIR